MFASIPLKGIESGVMLFLGSLLVEFWRLRVVKLKQDCARVVVVSKSDVASESEVNCIELCVALTSSDLPIMDRYVTLSEQSVGLFSGKATTVLTDTHNNKALATFPHLTLYQLAIPLSSLKGVISTLSSLASKHSTLAISEQKVQFNGHEESLEIVLEKSDGLAALQKAVLSELNKFREGHLVHSYPDGVLACALYNAARVKEEKAKADKERNIQKLNDMSMKDSNILNFGWPDGSSLFSPHVTLSWGEGDFDEEALKVQLKEDQVFDRLGLFVMGEQGTCTQKLCEFALR